MSIKIHDLTAATVTLDGMEEPIRALLPANGWNGWECPYFRPDDVRAHRVALESLFADDDTVTFTWDDASDLPSIVETYDDGESEDYVSRVTIDGEEFVTIGWASFTWSEV